MERPQPQRVAHEPERRGTRASQGRYATAFGGKFSKASHEVRTSRPTRSGWRPTSACETAPPVSLATMCHVAELERLEEVGHDPRHSEQRQVGLAVESDRVPAERHVEGDAAVAARKLGHDLPPQVAVHGGAVDEHHRRTAAALAVLERAGRHLHGAALAERLAHGHAGKCANEVRVPPIK